MNFELSTSRLASRVKRGTASIHFVTGWTARYSGRQGKTEAPRPDCAAEIGHKIIEAKRAEECGAAGSASRCRLTWQFDTTAGERLSEKLRTRSSIQ